MLVVRRGAFIRWCCMSVPPGVKPLGEFMLESILMISKKKKKNNVWGEDTADNVLKMISNPFRSFHLGLLQLVYHKISMLILIEKMLPKHQILGVYPVISLPHFWTQPYGAWKPVGCAAAHHCITASTAARPPAERGSICPRATCSRFEMWSRRHQMAITWRCYDSSPKLLWQWFIWFIWFILNIVWIIDIIYTERIGWSEVPFIIIQLLRVVSPCMRAAICMSLHY